MDRVVTFTTLAIFLIVIRIESPTDIHPPELVWWGWVLGQFTVGAGLGISIYKLVKERP